MYKIQYSRDRTRNELVLGFQGFLPKGVVNNLKEKGFRLDWSSKTGRAHYSEEAESYVKYLEEAGKRLFANSQPKKPK